MTTYFDLSQPVRTGMLIFPGDPAVEITPAEGAMAPWQVSTLKLGTHTGTHIDAASHYIPGGNTIEQYPLSRFILPGIVVHLADLAEDQAITGKMIAGKLKNLPEGGAILIQTDWDQYWESAKYFRHPHLSAEAVEALMEAHASLVGIDALNVDSTVQSTEHVHRLLLGHDILIVENLAHLKALQERVTYMVSFLPIHLVGLDGSPVRAAAWQVPSNHSSRGDARK
jgi:kynurenine formamidase